jgi:hypothetical protein
MNSRLILVASLALVLAGPAFAQDSYTPPPTDEVKTSPPVDDTLTDDADQKAADESTMAADESTMAADESTMAADENKAGKTTMTAAEHQKMLERAKVMATRIPGTAAVLAPSVPPIISDSAPQPVAANVYDPRKDLMRKVYPTVDRGHVGGDPPVIDHSADIMPVTNPTTSVATIPSGD